MPFTSKLMEIKKDEKEAFGTCRKGAVTQYATNYSGLTFTAPLANVYGRQHPTILVNYSLATLSIPATVLDPWYLNACVHIILGVPED